MKIAQELTLVLTLGHSSVTKSNCRNAISCQMCLAVRREHVGVSLLVDILRVIINVLSFGSNFNTATNVQRVAIPDRTTYTSLKQLEDSIPRKSKGRYVGSKKKSAIATMIMQTPITPSFILVVLVERSSGDISEGLLPAWIKTAPRFTSAPGSQPLSLPHALTIHSRALSPCPVL